MSATSLTHPRLTEFNGMWYLLGYADGQQWIQKSVDNGATWLPFGNGQIRSQIGASDNAAGSIIKLHSQGSRLLVAIPKKPNIHIYISTNDGDTWTLDSTVETTTT